ncbi:CPSF A subunit region-domain-containing protein [Microdochium trichocladiopsis]|uniref:Protein CFT1 n=1 Tax=Microdochium trichocladiopsis TaxID=1682393 RepID=A0A9P8Y1F6_9PEZI|nr:CPSF A subunit region-domain-containing protein [Microdochium trichocladiopsis]KAH7027437.1 CPSF A subunit region-domain-containing protein [Microdochium trichocladiopsis]
MQCYSELTPPTAVSHSVVLPFLTPQSNNLVVAKASLLQIFSTKNVSAEFDNTHDAQTQTASRYNAPYDSRLTDDDGLETSFLGGDSMTVRADRSSYTKLVLVAEYPLTGTVTGLARIKTQKSKSGGEALLISFRDAKLSMVGWDPEKYSLYTTSIHYYEQDDLQGSPWEAPLSNYASILTADPSSRCAALKFGPRKLAIIQFATADEDIEMDDWDEELDGPRPVKEQATATANGASNTQETPVSNSFVLRFPNLDPSLIHPVHLTFLHEYREPTFGILFSTMAPSAVLGRKDHLIYMVFTLDLQQKASTTILSVTGLPQDLFRIIALPAPVGGALLIGANEMVHIDQSGKTHGVGVNPFAKQSTSFSLNDQSDLDLRLEGCELENLSPETGELLIVLADGRLALLKFEIDGRTVAGFHVQMVSPEAGASIVQTSATTLSRVAKNAMFVGSESGDSLVIGWARNQLPGGKRKARAILEAAEDIDMDDVDLEDLEDDDDLYGESSATTKQTPSSAVRGAKSGQLHFRVHDRLVSIAPIRNFTVGQTSVPSSEVEKANVEGVRSDLSLVCATGRGASGAVSIINRQIQPNVIGRFDFPEARGFWTVSAHKPMPKSMQGEKGTGIVGAEADAAAQHDKYMIVSKVDLDGYETSDVYALTGAGFEALTGTEFEPAAGLTIEAGTIGQRQRIIQVLKTAVHVYDGDFGLSQILPMLDEESGAEPRVESASIVDPFIMLVREDASVFIAEIDSDLELEELEKDSGSVLATTKWATGCLYDDVKGVFSSKQPQSGFKPGENIVMFLLSKIGALYVYSLPDISKPLYIAEGLSFVPPILSANYTARRGTARENLKEILVADVGDSTYVSPYLLVRQENEDITIYQAFRVPSEDAKELSDYLHFQKLSNPTFANVTEQLEDEEDDEPKRNLPMRSCQDIAGYTTVFIPGDSPRFILKTAKSVPKVIGLQGRGIRGMSAFHTEGCEHGFIYADMKGVARVAQIPNGDTTYADIGMSLTKLSLQADVHSIAHHPTSETFAVGCDIPEPFELPKEDDYHREWQNEKDLVFKPTVPRGVIKLLSTTNWSVIDTVELEECETVMCIETLNLEVSESTHERKNLLVVGTAVAKGEDLPIKGRVIVYDVVEVIPEPGRPETNRRLKLVAKEDIPRGAVTALSEIGTQGLMLVAQGQKCMVRGLKEDGSLLPVAFMDMSCYVTAVRELKGTGLCLMADAVKGVWFTGYTEEPYKMILFGKSATILEVLTVDFLPDGDELFIVACDSDGGVHVLQFDPEHPKSLQGHLLLHRTTFSAGAHPPTRSRLLPRTLPATSDYLLQLQSQTLPSTNGTIPPPPPPSVILFSSPTGVLSTLAALSEPQYRRLSFLSTQLASSLPLYCGLNPKEYRNPANPGGVVGKVSTPAVDASVGRSIVDVSPSGMLGRWNELGAGRRAEIAGRVGFGGGVDEVREVLREVLGGAGLGYL